MNSRSKKIPAVRRDIQWYSIQQDGQQWIAVYDQMGYSRSDIAFPAELQTLFSFFTGNLTWEILHQSGLSEQEITIIEQLVGEMDEAGLLETAAFEQRRKQADTEFVESTIRKPVCANSVYPSNPAELYTFFENALAQVKDTLPTILPKGLFAPHIDFKVNLSVYAPGFKALKQIKPRHVYIIGTSHYSGLFREYDNQPFQFSTKSFELPGRTLKNNIEKTTLLANSLKESGATLYDISHKAEHSLELHAVWASHIWKHDFTITPILVGSFEDTLYMSGSELEKRIEQFSKMLKSVLTEDDFVLISGDLSHIGKKFGNKKPASDVYPFAREFDQKFLQAATLQHSDEIFSLMRSNKDAYNICGYPPLQSVLHASPFSGGKQMAYSYWDEKPRESGVSFGSILYF